MPEGHSSEPMPSAAEMAAKEELQKLWAIWQVKNQRTALYFAAAILSVTAMFAIAHWTRRLFDKHNNKTHALRLAVSAATGPLRWVPYLRRIRRGSFAPTRLMLALAYLTINVTLTFYDRADLAGLTILAKRFGW